MASGLGGPVAVFNNGQVVFVRSCRSGVWVGLDGSATGEVAAAEQDGLIAGLTLAQGEGAGVALAWSRFSLIGGVHSLAQVLVADILGTTLAPIGGDLAFESGLNASQGGISLAFIPRPHRSWERCSARRSCSA